MMLVSLLQLLLLFVKDNRVYVMWVADGYRIGKHGRVKRMGYLYTRFWHLFAQQLRSLVHVVHRP